ncbi:MAG: DUF2934 domain-containing protein [Bryobacteraceae bacterium]
MSPKTSQTNPETTESLMDRYGDHDGKSKSASAADGRHYPDPGDDAAPAYQDIAARAHQIWLEQGQPLDSAEQNWLEAERELRASATSRRLVEQVHEHAGSVQR